VVLTTASGFQFGGLHLLYGLVLALVVRQGLRKKLEVRLNYRKRLALRITRAKRSAFAAGTIIRRQSLVLVLSYRAGRKTRLRFRAGGMKLSLSAS
jgi:hypothetical protein